MKTKVIITIALLILLGACKKEESQIILSGILPDLKNETIILIPIDDHFPGLTTDGAYHTVKTDSLGGYKFSIPGTNSNFYQIIKNDFNFYQLKADIYLETGDSIFIDQSSWIDIPRFAISGKGSEKLKHLETDCSIFHEYKSFYDKIRSDYFDTELLHQHMF